MFLSEKEEELFWLELDSYEKEEKMPYITSVERIGYKKGGIFILAKQIAAKYKANIKHELTYLAGLDADDLAELSVLILNIKSLNEIHDWIDERVGNKMAVL